MRDLTPEIKAQGASCVAVGLGDTDYARRFRDDEQIPFPLLIDERKRAYRAAGLKRASLLHLLRPDNFTARRAAKGEGHRQHALGRDPLQLGAAFVFGPGDEDLYAHLSETFGDNPEPDELMEAVKREGLGARG